MNEPDRWPAEFPAAFDETFGRLQLLVAEAGQGSGPWQLSVARALVAVLDFAATEPALARVVTTDALAYGSYGAFLYRQMVEYFAGALAACSGRHRPEHLPGIVEEALVAGVIELVAMHLRGGRQDELPGIASQVVELTLMPYLGAEDAKHVALEVAAGG